MSNERGLTIVYDGDCPFCSAYVKFMRLREAAGNVTLVNAREDHPAVEFVRTKGYVINDGMALIDRGTIYHGADCLNRLALMSTPSSMFNRINSVIFRSPTLSRIIYPVLRFGRNITVKALGRSQLDY